MVSLGHWLLLVLGIFTKLFVAWVPFLFVKLWVQFYFFRYFWSLLCHVATPAFTSRQFIVTEVLRSINDSRNQWSGAMRPPGPNLRSRKIRFLVDLVTTYLVHELIRNVRLSAWVMRWFEAVCVLSWIKLIPGKSTWVASWIHSFPGKATWVEGGIRNHLNWISRQCNVFDL